MTLQMSLRGLVWLKRSSRTGSNGSKLVLLISVFLYHQKVRLILLSIKVLHRGVDASRPGDVDTDATILRVCSRLLSNSKFFDIIAWICFWGLSTQWYLKLLFINMFGSIYLEMPLTVTCKMQMVHFVQMSSYFSALYFCLQAEVENLSMEEQRLDGRIR